MRLFLDEFTLNIKLLWILIPWWIPFHQAAPVVKWYIPEQCTMINTKLTSFTMLNSTVNFLEYKIPGMVEKYTRNEKINNLSLENQ